MKKIEVPRPTNYKMNQDNTENKKSKGKKLKSSSSHRRMQEEATRQRRANLLKKFKEVVRRVIKMNKSKRHSNGNCFTSFFFCQFNSLFHSEEVKEQELRPLPDPVTSRKIMAKYDKIYSELSSKNSKSKSKSSNKNSGIVS